MGRRVRAAQGQPAPGRRHRVPRSVVVGLLIVTAVLTSCTSEPAGVDEPAPVEAQEIEAAVAEFRSASQAVMAGAQESLDSGAVVEVYADLRDVVSTSRDRFAALDLEGAEAEARTAFVDALDGLTEALDAVLAAAERDDDAAVREALAGVATAMVGVGDAYRLVDGLGGGTAG